MTVTRKRNSAGSGNLVLLGPPGSGKGTQAKILQEKYDMIHISTGDIIRNAIANSTEAGKIAKEQINRGFLVTDELISMLLKEHISTLPDKPIIFDGYPRTVPQIALLDEITSIDTVIELTIDEDALIRRVVGRLNCDSCGAVYHKDDNISTCICGSTSFSTRADDNEITIRTRLEEYNEKTKPISAVYEYRNILHRLDGMKEVSQVTQMIMELL